MSDALEVRYTRRVARERAARKEAERLLEERSLALYQANLRLKESALALEAEVQNRTFDLQQALKAAEIATRAKSEFLAVMSHEIRTPLNGILGTCELLALSDLNSDQKALLDTIARCGDSLLVVINDILDFSKIEAGHLVLDPQPTSVQAEVESLMALYRPLAEGKGIRLSMHCASGLPGAVMVDQTRLRQVVSNLLTNAIKFTQSGGVHLAIAGSPEKDDAPPHGGSTALSGLFRLHVSVSDTGIGIAPDALSHLFQPFSQADSSTTRRFGGTGLGLVICERLVKAMGGRIQVHSTPGQGSCFEFFIRLPPVGLIGQRPNPDPTQEATPEQIREARFNALLASENRPSLLLVEDNPVNQTLALKLIEKMGLKADLACDGQEALECVNRKKSTTAYDVILMDMQMPSMDGLEATRRIRALALPFQPRIIALTANAFESDKHRCLEAGMDDFLPKPFKFEALRQALRNALVPLATFEP
jgi:two-component system, sensor histidine kinase